MDGAQWIVKFSEEGDATDVPLVEHACMTLASKARIRVAATQPIRVSEKKHAVAVCRFDRAGAKQDQRRLHAQTAYVALRAEDSAMGYPELAQVLRRRGQIDGGVAKNEMRELFRRMVFNILMDNTDDHEKNHVIVMDDAQRFHLAPAFDSAIGRFRLPRRALEQALGLGPQSQQALRARFELLKAGFYESFVLDPFQLVALAQIAEAEALAAIAANADDAEEAAFIHAIDLARAARLSAKPDTARAYADKARTALAAFSRSYPDSMRAASTTLVLKNLGGGE